MKTHRDIVSFRALVAASMKMTLFWYVAPCSPVETDRRFRGAYCYHHQRGDKHILNTGQFVSEFCTDVLLRVFLVLADVSASWSFLSFIHVFLLSLLPYPTDFVLTVNRKFLVSFCWRWRELPQTPTEVWYLWQVTSSCFKFHMRQKVYLSTERLQASEKGLCYMDFLI